MTSSPGWRDRKQAESGRLEKERDRHVLLKFEVLVLHTRLVDLNALDGDEAFPWREETSVRGGVGEEEPVVCMSDTVLDAINAYIGQAGRTRRAQRRSV